MFGIRVVQPGTAAAGAGASKAFRFIDRMTGTASAINLYVDSRNRATRLTAALYSDKHGHVGSRIARGSLASPRAGAWNSIAIHPTRVTRGKPYWIAVLGTGGSLYFRSALGRCSGKVPQQSGLSMPTNWARGHVLSSCPASGYVSGTPATGGSGNLPIVAGPFAPAPSGPTNSGTTPGTTLGNTPTTQAPALPTVPPVNLSAPVVSGSPVQGNVLTTSDGTWSDTPATYTYAWQDCDSLGLVCSTIGGANANSYTLAAGDVGHTIRSVVTATNGGGSSLPASSAATATVTAPPPPSPPSNTALPVVSGTAQQGQALSTSNGSWSGSPTSYSYQWEDCNSSGASCTVIGGATSSSYTLVAGDVGHTIRSVVTASNAGGSTPATSAQTGVVAGPPSPPSNTALPAVGGTAQQGSKLTTNKGTWTGSPTSYAYKWQDCDSAGANCTAITGATATTYTLVAGDVGHTIRSTVTATNAGGSTPATSAQTAVVAAPPSPPSNTALPVVSGTAQQSQVLSTTNGTWTGSPTSYAYQWEDCNSSGASCSAITGATSSSYTLAAGDVGDTIRAVVTATNAGGSTPATSAQTAVVTASGGGGGGGLSGVSMGFDVACDLATSNPWADMNQDFLFTLQTTNGSSLDTAGQCVSSLNVPNWVSAVHAHSELAFITIGGIADQDWPTACNNTNRAAFVTNLVNYMKTNGFDGIDLDIEDNAWAGQNPPVAAWDTCVQAIATAAHATTTASGARPLVSEDVTTPWMGPYVTDSVPYLDQFNLMTYGESTSQVGSDVASSVAAGIPKNKSVIGVDIVDYGEPSGGCGQYGSYAQTQGLAGVMVWDIHSDTHSGSFPCFTGLAPYVG